MQWQDYMSRRVISGIPLPPPVIIWTKAKAVDGKAIQAIPSRHQRHFPVHRSQSSFRVTESLLSRIYSDDEEQPELSSQFVAMPDSLGIPATSAEVERQALVKEVQRVSQADLIVGIFSNDHS